MDPRPSSRIRNQLLLRALHYRWRECALCGATDSLSLHHVLKHPRDDVKENLVMVCGDGVRGCHGRIEAQHGPTLRLLVHHILDKRPDVLTHVVKVKGATSAESWFRRQMEG